MACYNIKINYIGQTQDVILSCYFCVCSFVCFIYFFCKRQSSNVHSMTGQAYLCSERIIIYNINFPRAELSLTLPFKCIFKNIIHKLTLTQKETCFNEVAM